jgi:hypothetical protein
VIYTFAILILHLLVMLQIKRYYDIRNNNDQGKFKGTEIYAAAHI